MRGKAAYERQEATERNTGVQGDDRVGRRLAADCVDRRYTWSLGAGAAGLLCLAAGAGLLMHTRERRGPGARALLAWLTGRGRPILEGAGDATDRESPCDSNPSVSSSSRTPAGSTT